MAELQQAPSVIRAGRVAARASAAPRGAVDEGGKPGMSEEGEQDGDPPPQRRPPQYGGVARPPLPRCRRNRPNMAAPALRRFDLPIMAPQ